MTEEEEEKGEHDTEKDKDLENKNKKKEVDYTCNDCDFQANSNTPLKYHEKTTGHNVNVVEENEIKECFDCDKAFRNYQELMKHRKVVHPSTKKCKYFPKCHFGPDCPYVHEDEMDLDMRSKATIAEHEQVLQIKCNVCGNNFSSKHNLMKHRKKEHQERIRPCRDFLKRSCSRGDDKCWYKHQTTEVPTPQRVQPQVPQINSEKDFPQAWPNDKPPESGKLEMNKVVNMMEMVLEIMRSLKH